MWRAVLSLGLLVTVTACGGDEETVRPESATAATTDCVGYGCSDALDAQLNEQESAANEQALSVAEPGGDTATFPDGLQVTLVAVEVPDPEVFRQQKDGEQPLVLTTRWANTGDQAIEFPSGPLAVTAQLLAGPNGFDSTLYGVGGPDTDLPARIVPGSTFDYRTYYSVPDTSVLEFVFSPDSSTYPASTFTEVETLLP